MTAMDRRVAAGIVEQALGAVYDPSIVRTLREDSPLDVLGIRPADAVCIADAVHAAAPAFGAECVLDDADVVDVETVADLVDAVVAAGERG